MSFSDLILQLLHAQQSSRNDALLDLADGRHQARGPGAHSLIALATVKRRELNAWCRVQAAANALHRAPERIFDDVIGGIAINFRLQTYDDVLFGLFVFIACLQSGKIVTTDISPTATSDQLLPLSVFKAKFSQSLNNFRVTSPAENTLERNTILFVCRCR